eukprot:7182716-Pyramimonas_sp.AAC.1
MVLLARALLSRRICKPGDGYSRHDIKPPRSSRCSSSFFVRIKQRSECEGRAVLNCAGMRS